MQPKGVKLSFAQDGAIDIKDLDALADDLLKLKRKHPFIKDWELE